MAICTYLVVADCGGRIELVDCCECIRVISMGVRLCVL